MSEFALEKLQATAKGVDSPEASALLAFAETSLEAETHIKAAAAAKQAGGSEEEGLVFKASTVGHAAAF